MKAADRKKHRTRRRVRNIIIVVVVVLVALAALVIWARRRVTESFGTTNEVISARVTTGSIRTSVSGSGTLAGSGGEEVSLPDGITVNTLFVEDGDAVAEGDLLALADLSSVLSALSDVQAALDELDEQISAAAEDEADTTAYSMGFVTADTSSGDTTLLTLVPEDTMTVSIAVDETDILSLAVGQEAEVSVEALDSERFSGTVTEIDTAAAGSGGVTAYTVEITLDRADGMLSGMTADVSITIEGVDDAMLLPAAAVTRTSSSAYVFTSWDEESGELGGMTEVTTGLSNGSYIEITGGLREGDTVYYSAGESSDNLFGMMAGGITDILGEMGSSGSDFFDNFDSDSFSGFGGFGGPGSSEGGADFGGDMSPGGFGGAGR